MGYPLKKILASLPPGPRPPPIFIGVAEPLPIYHESHTDMVRGVATDFLVVGTNRRQVANLPQNTLKIGKGGGFGPLHSRIWR